MAGALGTTGVLVVAGALVEVAVLAVYPNAHLPLVI